MGYKQRDSVCFLNFKEKRFVGRLQLHREGAKWGRFRFKFNVKVAEVSRANILPHSASGPTSPEIEIAGFAPILPFDSFSRLKDKFLSDRGGRE